MDKKVAIGLGVLAAIGLYVWYQKDQAAKKSTIVSTSVPYATVPPNQMPPPGGYPAQTPPNQMPPPGGYPAQTPIGTAPQTPAGVPIYPVSRPTATSAQAFMAMPQAYRYPT